MKKKEGFTFIELLITLVVIGISFLPLMQMFTMSLEQASTTSTLATARSLAQEGMEKTKNLGFTEAQFTAMGNVWEPPVDEKPLRLNKTNWRILREVVPGTDPLQINIQVYQEFQNAGLTKGRARQLMIEMTTLLEDFDWAYAE